MMKKRLQLTVTVETGLHIGSGKDMAQIGGIDSEVIKDPVNKLPYIPGSSIKGKLRCLLETEGFEKGELDDTLNLYFGPKPNYIKSKNDGGFTQSPTRLLFRDLMMVDRYRQDYQQGKWQLEIKTEISVDRKKGTARDGGLRTIERVPPGVEFEGEVLIRFSDQKECSEIESVLRRGLDLLKSDSLGGSGSRGYGAVSYQLSELTA